MISIRAPRAGRDVSQRGHMRRAEAISIRAPRAGRDVAGFRPEMSSTRFQSARPVRGATTGTYKYTSPRPISIRAPRAGRDCDQIAKPRRRPISIRAPRAGRDSKNAQIVLHFFNNSQPKIEIQRPAQAGRAIYTFMQTAMPVKPSANLLSIGCSLAVRTISSVYLPANKFSCSRNARSSFRTAFPDSKTANYRAWDP